MLSSIILSMAMSVSPAPAADVHNLNIQEVGNKRGSRRLSNENILNVETVGNKRGSRRLSNENILNVETVGNKRGSRRL